MYPYPQYIGQNIQLVHQYPQYSGVPQVPLAHQSRPEFQNVETSNSRSSPIIQEVTEDENENQNRYEAQNSMTTESEAERSKVEEAKQSSPPASETSYEEEVKKLKEATNESRCNEEVQKLQDVENNSDDVGNNSAGGIHHQNQGTQSVEPPNEFEEPVQHHFVETADAHGKSDGPISPKEPCKRKNEPYQFEVSPESKQKKVKKVPETEAIVRPVPSTACTQTHVDDSRSEKKSDEDENPDAVHKEMQDLTSSMKNANIGGKDDVQSSKEIRKSEKATNESINKDVQKSKDVDDDVRSNTAREVHDQRHSMQSVVPSKETSKPVQLHAVEITDTYEKNDGPSLPKDTCKRKNETCQPDLSPEVKQKKVKGFTETAETHESIPQPVPFTACTQTHVDDSGSERKGDEDEHSDTVHDEVQDLASALKKTDIGWKNDGQSNEAGNLNSESNYEKRPAGMVSEKQSEPIFGPMSDEAKTEHSPSGTNLFTSQAKIDISPSRRSDQNITKKSDNTSEGKNGNNIDNVAFWKETVSPDEPVKGGESSQQSETHDTDVDDGQRAAVNDPLQKDVDKDTNSERPGDKRTNDKGHKQKTNATSSESAQHMSTDPEEVKNVCLCRMTTV